jgi:hypothetical protein
MRAMPTTEKLGLRLPLRARWAETLGPGCRAATAPSVATAVTPRGTVRWCSPLIIWHLPEQVDVGRMVARLVAVGPADQHVNRFIDKRSGPRSSAASHPPPCARPLLLAPPRPPAAAAGTPLIRPRIIAARGGGAGAPGPNDGRTGASRLALRTRRPRPVTPTGSARPARREQCGSGGRGGGGAGGRRRRGRSR